MGVNKHEKKQKENRKIGMLPKKDLNID